MAALIECRYRDICYEDYFPTVQRMTSGDWLPLHTITGMRHHHSTQSLQPVLKKLDNTIHVQTYSFKYNVINIMYLFLM